VPSPGTDGLDQVVPRVIEAFSARSAARDRALEVCRAVIRQSANCIRAIHREDAETARELLERAGGFRDEVVALLQPYPELYFAGYLHDAQKEYAEAATTLALLSGERLPGPEELGVEYPAYLNGIAEAIGELRRAILDRLRQGRFEGCEDLLDAMDDIYSILVTIDFPDALTGNLRRTTDQSRGILEKTRGDLTMAILQRALIPRSPLPAAAEERGNSR
jgi:translin